MPFVKLDCGMITSTIWIDQVARDVFITALLLAQPQEFPEPVPTIKIGRLDDDDFIVPPGWYGFVPAAGPGIVRLAHVDDDAGQEALKRLAAEDLQSRSDEFGGRRMVRVNGGFIILNYIKYRDRDYTSAERQRRFRERKRQSVTPLPVTVTRNITQADSREQIADIERTKKKPSANAEADSRHLPVRNFI
jgi:hypothetical protein